MHISDGLRAYGIERRAVIILVILPFLLIGLHCVGASPENRFYSSHVSLQDSVFIAGTFQYLDVTLPTEHEKICIIAYNGPAEPEPQNRSETTYYKWVYDHGVWIDVSGYDSSYMNSTGCSAENATYSFCIKISQKAQPGSWTFKVLVDDKETSVISFNVMIGDFCLFFSSIIGVFEPTMRQKPVLSEQHLRCCPIEKKPAFDEENIERVIDTVLKRQSTERKDEQPPKTNKVLVLFSDNSEATQEPLRSTITLYPRSKLRGATYEKIYNGFFNKIRGMGHNFFGQKSDGLKRFCIVILICLLLSVSLLPLIVSPGKDLGSGDITIITVQSYPLVGGKWTVFFTTVGQANLTISAVNGTTWSDIDQDHDLRFLHCRKGNETLQYQWRNNSVVIPSFSSNITCIAVCEVLTVGAHTLRFQFGNDVAYAHNLALENWLQTTTSDFNNGTKDNINVSDNAFHLMERYYLRNFTLIDDEGFEGSWLPAGWSEDPPTSNWNREGDQRYQGTYSADFDGATGAGGASGNLLSPVIDCSGSNVTAIYVKFWGYEYNVDEGEYYLDYYDGTTWDEITRLDNFGSGAWAQYSQKVTDSQYFKSNFQIRWRVVGLNNNEHLYVDLVNVSVERNESGYHPAGSLLSQTYDTTKNMPDYYDILINTTVPIGTTITTWVRAADSQANLSNATWYTDISQIPDRRWVQWRINLTGDTYDTPVVNEVNLTWIYDDEYPVSTVTSLSSYWQSIAPFEVSAIASDNGTGIKEVALYYNFSADNSSAWSGWTLYEMNDTTSPYSWLFTAPQGDGYYRFYSRAIDGELNTENPPESPDFDVICGLDRVKPTSRLDNITPYWYMEPARNVIVNCTNANDSLSGLHHIIMYYRYRMDNESAWGDWLTYGSDFNSPWSWTFKFPKSKGFYQLYTIAYDNAGNMENPPESPDNDTECAYNTTRPYSEVDDVIPYWHSTPITLTAQATDFNGSGLQNVSLYYYFSNDNSSWSTYSWFADDTDPWNSIGWLFTFPDGDGYYRFFSLACDNDSSVEYFTDNDTICGYETMKPSSQVDSLPMYWYNAVGNPLTLTVTLADDEPSGVKNITLYYRYRTSNLSSWNAWTSFDRDEAAPWSWDFDFPFGDGRYQFYSIAYDIAGNGEEPPTSSEYDAECGYETSRPFSQINPISPSTVMVSPLPLTASASDDTKNVTLWYYYSTENSSWWNPCWSYRKLLVIQGKNEGFHMNLVVGNTSGGNVTCNGHVQDDFDDIRFVSYSDNTTQLSYWLRNYTANVQGTFWLNNSQNDTYIWMYYGNSNASTTSSGEDTFYFFDDFSNGLNKWVMDSWNTDSIFVNQSQGNPSPALRHNPDNSIPANRTYQDTRIRTQYKILNGVIEYDVYLAGTARVIHQFGWRVNDLSWTNGYAWRLQNSAGDGGFFEFSAPAVWTHIGAAFPVVSTGTWYHVKIDVSDDDYSAQIDPAAPSGASTRSVTDSTKTTADYLVSHVHGVSMTSANYVLVDTVFVRKYRVIPSTWSSFGSEEMGYVLWSNSSNPDQSSPWSWGFNFPDSYGYYWFYSLAIDMDGNEEYTPNLADAWCQYVEATAPVINTYDIRNATGSKLNNATGLLDVNTEYYFVVNVSVKYGWEHLDYIDIKAWYDDGDENSSYNQTAGGNLNMYLRYENTSGNATYSMIWPDDEAQLIQSNCSEMIINSTTRVVNFWFIPLSQVRWACSNNTWDSAYNTSNDPFSWNFNITAIDLSGLKSWKRDEYGVYKFATLQPQQDWVDVRAPPGYTAPTSVVNVTYSSNYDFNISLYFEENLTNVSSGGIIPIAYNVYIRADADLYDDITADMMFDGIGEENAIEIINASGVFHKNNISQLVRVQFNVYIPFGTIRGHYTAHVATKIKQKE